jgi:NMD protein affecting ribosome stability and mRNA decay
MSKICPRCGEETTWFEIWLDRRVCVECYLKLQLEAEN